MSLRRGWRAARRFAGSPTGRLGASYLAVIMIMSLGFSLVLYYTSAHELRKQLPPQDGFRDGAGLFDDDFIPPQRVNDFLRERGEAARRTLIGRLVMLNAGTLVAGSALSLYLARRTLRPIEANFEAQAQFVGDASHELRTPLTSLQTSNEVALRNRHLTVAQSRELLRQNIEEVAKLQTLTDGLLQLARQDRAAVTLGPVSLQDVAADALNGIVDAAQAKNMSVDDSVPAVMVQADAGHLSRALAILLDNAVKYAPEGSTIRLAGGAKGKQGYVRVIDRGPGISQTDQQRIFDRFYRADQSRSSQHVTGYGIGLSLAKKLVGQQGGTIEVSSQPGKGAAFTIYLPLA